MNLFVDNLSCSGRIKMMSGDMESFRRALSIGGGSKAKYQSFVNRLNSRGVYRKSSLQRQSHLKILQISENRVE